MPSAECSDVLVVLENAPTVGDMPNPEQRKTRPIPMASGVLDDHSLVEMVYEPEEHQTRLCVFRDGAWRLEDHLAVNGQQSVPYSPGNNLIRHDVVLFPSKPADYGSTADLIAEIQKFIHGYVDVSPLFEKIATYYVLLSWVYDAFHELPYLRVRGDFGSGKTRALLTIGSLCYKPMFASGASTVSPLFRVLDAFQGTLVMDESDFRFSDERAEIIKILNNGHARGFPVLRSEVMGKHEYDPRAYAVYGPKIIATRGMFSDGALESRCITEDLGHRSIREDIPLNLPDSFKDEARELRNKLLLYRFRNRHLAGNLRTMSDRGVEPRITQVFAPLLSVIEDEQTASELVELARASSRQLVVDRGMNAEGQVLEVVAQLLPTSSGAIPLRAIASSFLERFGQDYENAVTVRWIGSVLRGRLQLRPHKSHGVFVLPLTEYPKLRRLFERYGVEDASSSTEGALSDPSEPVS